MKKNEISHWHKYSDPFIQYLVKAPSAQITSLHFHRYEMEKLGFGFGDFLSFLSADPLQLFCQVGWGLFLDSVHFHVSPEMIYWIQVRAMAGPLKDWVLGPPSQQGPFSPSCSVKLSSEIQE